MLFRAPPPLWTAVILVLSINLFIILAYRTGFVIMNMRSVASWPNLAVKPMAKGLRSHVIWGIVASVAMFAGSYNLLLQGQNLDWMALLSLIMAFVTLLTGFIRLYIGGTGRWHMYLACAAILVFGVRLLINVNSLGGAFLTLGNSPPTVTANVGASAVADQAIWQKNLTATVSGAGTVSGKKTTGVSLALSGSGTGDLVLNEAKLASPAGGVSADITGSGQITINNKTYQGKLTGVIKNGQGEFLFSGGGLEAVGTFTAPTAWNPGATVNISLQGMPGGTLPLASFKAPASSPAATAGSSGNYYVPPPATSSTPSYTPSYTAPATTNSTPSYTPPPAPSYNYSTPQSGC